MIPTGRPFFKMSGSGNDFVMVDARTEPPGELAERDVIGRVCARATGVGADGIVFLERSEVADVRLTYLNSDGSRADLCGNATLCTTRLSIELGIGDPSGFRIETDSGVVSARLADALPEIDLPPVTDVRPSAREIEPAHGERRIGFALVGVPHLVIACDDVSTVDVVGRGRPLRRHPSLPFGANVNFVAPAPGTGRWRMRTYERGVEAETLACGSGSVAAAILLSSWSEESGSETNSVELVTSSGNPLRVKIRRDAGAWYPTLSGEGRIVFRGELAEIL
jgi:diaminopimelate epimerase